MRFFEYWELVFLMLLFPFSANAQESISVNANGVSFKMVKVAGGNFTMGGTKEQGNDAGNVEKPTHNVTLSTYYIGETEVTQALWKAVMGSNPASHKGDNYPVENVSWNDCQTFIQKLNQITGRKFRLPTEAEWEYAARGGSKSRGYKYSGSNYLNDVAWNSDNCSSTREVKQKQRNEAGIYDMSGNVNEWCNDVWSKYSPLPQTNPKGPSKGTIRVLRGGNYAVTSLGGHRVSDRMNAIQSYKDWMLGLRLALNY